MSLTDTRTDIPFFKNSQNIPKHANLTKRENYSKDQFFFIQNEEQKQRMGCITIAKKLAFES